MSNRPAASAARTTHPVCGAISVDGSISAARSMVALARGFSSPADTESFQSSTSACNFSFGSSASTAARASKARGCSVSEGRKYLASKALGAIWPFRAASSASASVRTIPARTRLAAGSLRRLHTSGGASFNHASMATLSGVTGPSSGNGGAPPASASMARSISPSKRRSPPASTSRRMSRISRARSTSPAFAAQNAAARCT